MGLAHLNGGTMRPVALVTAVGVSAPAFLLPILCGFVFAMLCLAFRDHGRGWLRSVQVPLSCRAAVGRAGHWSSGKTWRRIVAEMKAGLSRGEFVPYYQPIVSLPGGALVGFESLARWEHPVAGLLGADSFIREAEDAALIHELSLALLERACADMRQWPAHLTLSINLSPLQLSETWIAPAILKILWTHGIAPARLIVELTESRRIADLPCARSVIDSLKAAGVQVALDDFGMGYSGLMRLRELSFDRIKIDRAFTGELARPENSEIIRAMLSLGDGLGVSVVAEGVETRCAAAQLVRLGCSYAQGFLYSPPVSAGAALDFIASSDNLPAQPRSWPLEALPAPEIAEEPDRGSLVYFPSRALG